MVTNMNALSVKRIVLNLLLIAVTVPLVWLVLIWLIGRVIYGASENPWEADAYLLNYLTLAPQMVLAGVFQQVVTLFVTPKHSSPKASRAIATVVAMVAVPGVLIVMMGGEAGMIAAPPVAIPLVVAITTYGLVMKLPLRSQEEA